MESRWRALLPTNSQKYRNVFRKRFYTSHATVTMSTFKMGGRQIQIDMVVMRDGLNLDMSLMCAPIRSVRSPSSPSGISLRCFRRGRLPLRSPPAAPSSSKPFEEANPAPSMSPPPRSRPAYPPVCQRDQRKVLDISAHPIALPMICKVSLTGSVPVGKPILKQCAETVKKVSMGPAATHRRWCSMMSTRNAPVRRHTRSHAGQVSGSPAATIRLTSRSMALR